MNPLLEETWHVKDALAREAGGDLHRLCALVRHEAARVPHRGPRIANAEELRHLLEQQSSRAWMLREGPPQ